MPASHRYCKPREKRCREFPKVCHENPRTSLSLMQSMAQCSRGHQVTKQELSLADLGWMITGTNSSKRSKCASFPNICKLASVIMVRAGGGSWARALSSPEHASSYFLTPFRASLSVLIFMCFIMNVVSGYECGGFIQVGPGTRAQNLTSPSHPDSNPNSVRCIWIVEAELQYVVKVNATLEGQSRQGVCTDLVQFRDGGERSALLAELCGNGTSRVVESTGRWMYVFLKTKGVGSGAVFHGVVVAKFTESSTNKIHAVPYSGSSTNKSNAAPYSDCKSYEFLCSNKLCLSMSYRCDGYYDCGCGRGCDEDGCGALFLNRYVKVGASVGVGLLVFLVVALLAMVMDRGHNWTKQETLHTPAARAHSMAGRRSEGGVSRDRKSIRKYSTFQPPAPSSPPRRAEISHIA